MGVVITGMDVADPPCALCWHQIIGAIAGNAKAQPLNGEATITLKPFKGMFVCWRELDHRHALCLLPLLQHCSSA